VPVIGRISSSKDESSKGGQGKSRQRVNIASNAQRREDERKKLAERLRKNTPHQIRCWDRVESGFHKWNASDRQEWWSRRNGQAAIIAKTKIVLESLDRGTEHASLTRALDGLMTNIGLLLQFLRFVRESWGLPAGNFLFHITEYYLSLKHSWQRLFKSLGSVNWSMVRILTRKGVATKTQPAQSRHS
jgi:hypothetical protein